MIFLGNMRSAILLVTAFLIVFSAESFASRPPLRNPAAVKLLARLSKLSEVVPSSKMTPIDPAGAHLAKSSSVRFFNGWLDGKRATLVFFAERDFTGRKVLRFEDSTPTPIMFSLFELRASETVEAGAFYRVASFRTSQNIATLT